MSYTKNWPEILSGTTNSVFIDSTTYNGVFFTGLEFKVGRSLAAVQIKVQTLSNAPFSTGEINGLAYKYMQMTEANLLGEDISNTKINFRVNKEWITNNSLKNTDIALFRYIGTEWVEQTTNFMSEDDSDANYLSLTSGFSYFAIGVKEGTVIEEPVVEEVIPTGGVVDEVTDETTDTETGLITKPRISKAPIFWGLLIIIVVVILVILFLKEGRHQQKRREEHFKEHGVHKPNDNLEKLEEYVKKQLGFGYPESHIKHTLKSVGWKEEYIDTAISKHKSK